MVLVCLTGQQTHQTWSPWRIYEVLSRGKWETRDQKKMQIWQDTVKETWASMFHNLCWITNNKLQIKLRWALFVTYTIIQSIMRSEMCSLHLTHPSAHTPGAVGSRHCGARGAVGASVPCSRVSPQSWTLPARARIQTHNLGLQVQCSIH